MSLNAVRAGTQIMAIHSRSDIVERIRVAVLKSRSVTFLLGTGLTLPIIPGAASVIERAIQHHRFDEAWLDDAGSDTGARYRLLMEKLRAKRGIDETTKLMQDCVLDAFTDEEGRDLQIHLRSETTDPLTTEKLNELMARNDSWQLSPAVDALGRLLTVTTVPPFRILTTNFDPLIEIAARRHDVLFDRVSLQTATTGDANPDVAVTERPQVVFLHGRWLDYMRHTDDELVEHRPYIETWLYERLKSDLVVVGGYGGWHDSFSSALRRASSDRKVELCWTARSEDSLPSGELGKLIQSMSGHFYSDCDLASLFEDLIEEFSGTSGLSTVSTIANSTSLDDALTSLQRRHAFGYSAPLAHNE